MPWTISTRGYTATSLKLGEPTPTDALLPPPCMLVTSGLTTPRFRTFMLTDTKLPHTQCRKYIAWNTSDATTLYTACCWGPIHSLHYTLHLLYINSSLLFFSRSLPWLLYTNFYVFYAAFWSFSFSTRLVWGVTQKTLSHLFDDNNQSSNFSFSHPLALSSRFRWSHPERNSSDRSSHLWWLCEWPE